MSDTKDAKDTKDTKVISPTPRPALDIGYVCRYESEIDRSLILFSHGHYIKEVLGTHEITFVKVAMDAVNRVFHVSKQFPGEETEYVIDHKHNNLIRVVSLAGDDLPSLWAVLENDEYNVKMIATMEPCKFIVKTSELELFDKIFAGVEIAPREYNYDALNQVYWNDTTMSLKRDIEFFITGKKFFDTRDIPYSRSYLLHGPPGNGKTTTIKAIAKFLNAKVESFDFSAASDSPDRDFQNWVIGESERIAHEETAYISYDDEEDGKTKTPIRFIVLEDIDRLYPKDGSKHTSVSLQAVLQALDGAIERRNMIIVATANHPKELDQQVLARPGRFDKQVFYEQPSVDESFGYLKRLFDGEETSDETLTKGAKSLQGFSYAFCKELFATAASYAIARMSKKINDDDVNNAINDMLKHIESNVMKSSTTNLGFGS